MSTTITIAGIIFLSLIGVAAVISAFAWAVEALSNRENKHYARRYDQAVREIGNRIRCQSYWLSEDKNCEMLMRALGNQMVNSNSTDLQKVREEWRNMRATPTKEKQP